MADGSRNGQVREDKDEEPPMFSVVQLSPEEEARQEEERESDEGVVDGIVRCE